MATLTGLQALNQFCTTTGFWGEIWIQVGWQHEEIDPPNWWKLKKDGSPASYIYSGHISVESFTIALCQYKEDRWQPSNCVVDGYAHLRDLAEQGATIYFYPNQPDGGISNNNVASSDLIFYEIDNLPLDQQWRKLNELIENTGLQPSAVIFTGGKSLHVYFKLSQQIDTGRDTDQNSHWRRLNRKLCVIQQSDPAINNPARAMRLPGMVRRKSANGELLPAINISLEQWSDSVYTPEEFEKALDATGLFPYGLSYSRWLKWRKHHLAGELDNAYAILHTPEEELIPKYEVKTDYERVSYNGEAIPLEWCLSREDKELLASGVVEHQGRGRDNSAYKLARNLIGTANQLISLGYSFSGNPEALFNEFCSKCSPSLPERDRQRIWKSANRGNPSSSLPPSIIEDIVSRYIKFQNWKPQSQKDKQISELEWRQKFGKKQQPTDKKIPQELWEWLHGIPGLFKKELAKIKRKFSGAEREKQKNLLESKVDLAFSQYQNRADLTIDALKNNKKFIHFGCHGGQGKTHFVAFLLDKLKEIDFECDHVVYAAKSGRNPATPELESNFRNLTICHNGLAEDPLRKTPLGYPVLVHPTSDNPAVTTGNCHLAAQKQKLIELGYDVHGISACQLLNCKLIDYCGKESGKGYGFRHERKLDLASPRIRLNPDSLPDEVDFLEGCILILDELGQLKSGVKTFELGLEDISAMQSYVLMNNAPELLPLLEALTELHRIAYDDKLPYYGCDIKQIREKLNIPESQHEAIIKAAEYVDIKLHKDVNAKNMNKAPKVWLTKFFTILFNQQHGALRIGKKELRKGDKTTTKVNITITTIDNRFRLILERAKAIVILDGTSTKESLSRLMGIDKNEIYSVAQIRPKYNNQKLIRISGLGNCGGGSPSESMIKRMGAIEVEAQKRHGENIPILKRTKHSNYEQWWVDSRAQNRDAGVPVRLSFGTPYQNLAAQQDRLITLTGQYHELGEANQRDRTSPELQAEIDFVTLMEFLQDLWRQRAHRYPDREFIQYYVTDFDLSPLTEICPGLQYEELDAFAFNPEAGDDLQQTKCRITQAIKEQLEAGATIDQIRQKDVLAKSGIKIDWLKKICSAFGGWSQLKKGVVALLGLYSATTPFEEDQLDQDLQWFLTCWLPPLAKEIKEGNLSALQDVGVYVATYGIKAFEKLCRFLDPSVRADILTGILSILPVTQLEQILEEQLT